MFNNMIIINICVILLAVLQKVKGVIESPCPKYFVFEPNKSEDDRWYGIITLNSRRDIKGVTLDIQFDKSIIQLGNWFGAVTSDSGNVKFSIKNDKKEIKANVPLKIEIYVVYDPYYDVEPPKLLNIRFNDREICPRYEEEQTGTVIISTGNDDYKTPTLLLNINVPRCGVTIATAIELITEGQYTKPGQYPWHAALYRKEANRRVYICGGSLISEQHVVTAAHCTTIQNEPRNPAELVVVLGKHGFWVDGKSEQTFTVTKINVHENFNRSNFFNDISILHLDKPTEYTKFVRPVCLWEDNASLDIVVNKTGTAVGWGRDHKNNPTTDLLMQAQMPVINTLQCIMSYPEFYSSFISGNNFCAGFRNGTSVCNGDSGGGLVFPKAGTSGPNQVWQLRGIVSNTVAKQSVCDPNYYVLFTDAAKYLDWISTNIKS